MADEKMKKILELIDDLSKKGELDVQDGTEGSNEAKIDAHMKTFKNIFENGDEMGNEYRGNRREWDGLASDENTDIKKDAFNNIMDIFKDAKIKGDNEVTHEEKKKVLALFKAILDFYKDDEDKKELLKSMQTLVGHMQTQVDDGTKGKSTVIFDGGDRCYRVSDGEDDSVNVRLIGKCDSKNNENDEMDDVWWEKLSKDKKEQIKKLCITKMGKKGAKQPLRASSAGGGRKRKSRKSKRKLRRKNRRKSKRKNRKSRRKSIKR